MVKINKPDYERQSSKIFTLEFQLYANLQTSAIHKILTSQVSIPFALKDS